MHRKPICFVPSRTDFDISGCKQYGTIERIYSRSLSPFSTESVFQVLEECLTENEYDPDLDYVVLTGSLNFTVLTIAYIILKYGRIKVLMFNNLKQTYKVRVYSSEVLNEIVSTESYE